MFFERKEVDVCNFRRPYRMSMPLIGNRKAVLGGEKMEKVKAFKNLNIVLDKR